MILSRNCPEYMSDRERPGKPVKNLSMLANESVAVQAELAASQFPMLTADRARQSHDVDAGA